MAGQEEGGNWRGQLLTYVDGAPLCFISTYMCFEIKLATLNIMVLLHF